MFSCSAWNDTATAQREIDFSEIFSVDENELDFAELAQFLQSDHSSIDKIYNVYMKHANKWTKKLIDCKKIICESQAFYQEGRSFWMKDLATLNRALQNIKSDCQTIINEVLSYADSLESKYFEILKEMQPFLSSDAKFKSDQRFNQDSSHNFLQEFSSSMLLLKINDQLRNKLSETDEFHAKINQWKSGGWIREEDALKTLDRVSKYVGSYLSTSDTTVNNDTLEEMNQQLKPRDLIKNKKNVQEDQPTYFESANNFMGKDFKIKTLQ